MSSIWREYYYQMLSGLENFTLEGFFPWTMLYSVVYNADSQPIEDIQISSIKKSFVFVTLICSFYILSITKKQTCLAIFEYIEYFTSKCHASEMNYL